VREAPWLQHIMSFAETVQHIRRKLLGSLYRFAYPLARVWWRLIAPVRIGVRAVVLDAQGRVLLVRHAYGSEGWGFPGGAPGRLEKLEDTARREVWEETGVRCQVERLLGVYDSFVEGKSDHVALFVCRTIETDAVRPASAEIVAAGFFAPDALPEGTSSGTQRRLAELQALRQGYWGLW
jgi:ADP-ribose pyrophosphatase YjhB (NUDIX family)